MSIGDRLTIISILVGLIGSFAGGIFSHYAIEWYEKHSTHQGSRLWQRLRRLATPLTSLTVLALVCYGAWFYLHRDEVQFHELPVEALSVAWSPDGRMFASGSREPFVRVWDARTGAELGRLRGRSEPIVESEPIHHLAFSPDNKRLAAGGISRFWVWDVERGDEYWTSSSFQMEPAPKTPSTKPDAPTVDELLGDERGPSTDIVQGLDFVPVASTPQRLLVAWYGYGLALYDVEARRSVGDFARTDRSKEGLAVSRDGRYAVTSGSTDEDFELWDLASRRLLSRSGPERPAAKDPRTELNLMLTESLSAHVTSVALSRNVRTMLSCRYANFGTENSPGQVNDIVVWDVATWKEVRRFHGHERRIAALSVSSNDRILTGSDDGTAALWDFDSGTLIRRYLGHLDSLRIRPAQVTAVAITLQGDAAVTAGKDRTLRVWALPR
jgi:WD40 repeat protein